nr:MAG TPA: hypothetical protein [Caudoviricetes sp.]
MTFDVSKARHKLAKQITEVRAKRNQQRLFSKRDGNCNHEWRLYKQRLGIDRNRPTGDIYCGPPGPYLVVYGCTKCHKKRYVDLKYL